MGQVGGKAVRMDMREISPLYREIDACIRSREFLDYVSRVTGTRICSTTRITSAEAPTRTSRVRVSTCTWTSTTTPARAGTGD